MDPPPCAVFQETEGQTLQELVQMKLLFTIKLKLFVATNYFPYQTTDPSKSKHLGYYKILMVLILIRGLQAKKLKSLDSLGVVEPDLI